MEIFDKILQIFNNREISIFCWVIIFIIWSLTQKSIRKSAFGVIKTLFAYKITIMILMMLIYISFFIILFYNIDIWDISILKDTIYWTFGVAFIMLMNINDASKNEHYFKQTLLNSFKLIIVIEFVTNLYVFNLFVELISLPIILFFVMISAFTERKEEHKKVKQLSDSLFAIYAIIVLIFSIYHISKDLNGFISIYNLKSLLLSPILTIFFLPFVYMTALFMTYESFLTRTKWILMENKKLFKTIKMKTFLSCRFNLRKIQIVSKKLHIYTTEDELTILNDLNLILKK